ncbi:SDR family NAD(P)-dependent oxidoreductase [Marinomonas epiphytica]
MTHSKFAFIIGGSSGIGLACAKQLLQQGCDVMILGKNADKLAQAKTSLASLGKIETLQADLCNPKQVSKAITSVQESNRKIDFLVNAAGYFNPKPFLDHNETDYDIYADINRASFFLSQAVARNMVQHGGGAIVHIGSMWAKQAIKATPSSAYSMAKAGLHALTQHMAMELADHNIRVNAVSPAVVKTPIYNAFIKEEELEQTLTSFNPFHPIGRIGTPDDIANSVLFLLSNKASWTTGSVIDVDGGIMSGRN